MTTETQAAFAARQGWSRQYVGQLKDAGVLVLSADGRRVEVEASLARIKDLGVGRLRPAVAARHAAQAAARAAERTGATPDATHDAARAATHDATDGLDAGLDTGGAGKARYKALTLHFENQLIKLGMQLARGQRFYREPVKDEAQGIGGALRAAVERLIDQTAPRLAVLSNHMDRGVLLKREARHIKRLLNLEYANALRRLRRSARKGKAE